MKTLHFVISILRIIILLILTFPEVFGQSYGQGIIINEIMYTPDDGEPEWVEIYNSSADSINLKNFSVADNKYGPYQIITSDYFLGAHKYLILADIDTIYSYYTYSFDYIVVNLPALNNTGDEVKLYNNLGEIVDSVAYDDAWGGKNGKSLERIKYEIDSNNSDNWGTSIDDQGASPGKYNSLSPKDYDLAVTSIRFSDSNGYEDSTVIVKCYINNTGLKTADRYRITIEEENITLLDEVFYDLQPGDSRMVFAELNDLSIGELAIECEVDFYKDMNNYNNSLKETLSVHPKKYFYNSLVVNEIMYKPYDDEPEWFELYNKGPDKINLYGWKFTDEYRSVYLPDTSYYLYPNEYLIISARDNLESFYEDIPADILKINLPSLNNTNDVIAAYDFHKNKIDSVYYSNKWGGYDYSSLERSDPSGLSNDSTNWHDCIDILRATPGRENTLGYIEYDIALTSFSCDSSYAVLGNTNCFTAEVTNLGRYSINNFEFMLFNDFNHNGIFEIDELIKNNSLQFDTEYGPLIILVETDKLIEGENHLLLEIVNELDQVTMNNQLELEINCLKLQMNPGDLVINEIMYSPEDNEEEWIEIYNTTDKNILLRGLTVCDSRSSKIWDKDTTRIKSHSFFVITKDIDSMEKYGTIGDFIELDFPTLNNNTDCVLIKDSLGRAICKVQYNSSWGGDNGRSLERVAIEGADSDSSNWKTSNIDIGATPWGINSVSQKDFDISIDTVKYIPVKPNLGENISLLLTVTNKGKTTTNFTLEIKGADGTENMEVLYPNSVLYLHPGEQREFEVKDLFACRGIHEISISCKTEEDEDSRNNNYSLTVFPSLKNEMLILNEIMYQPVNNEPEWIELYNNTSFYIPLKGLSISDVLTTPYIIEMNTRRSIKPFSYFVIAKDTSIISYHETVPELLIIPFANLNNSSDGVVIKDSYEDTIDSLFYGEKFKSERGHSLERISFTLQTNDSLNWISSLDAERSTPGRLNSIINFDTDISIENARCIPETPVIGDKINLEIELKNKGLFDCDGLTLNLYRDDENIPFRNQSIGHIKKSESLTLRVDDMMEVDKSFTLKIRINSPRDTCYSNNSYDLFVRVGPPKGSIEINEFMCYPAVGKGEWIEIYNSSPYEINLRDWSVSDNSHNSKKMFCTENTCILPGNYFVICNDSLMTKKLSAQNIKNVSVNFPALNNTGDEIIIYDSRGIIIDSLSYDSKWEINKGLSKEKNCLECSSFSYNNWLTSISSEGGTPGRINSVIGLSSVGKNSLVINEIMYNAATDNSEFVEFLNVSKNPIELASCYLLLDNKRIALCQYSNSLMPDEFFILSGDSVIFNNYPGLNSKNIYITNQNEFSLSNNSQTHVLIDLFGNTIDSVYYDVTNLNSSCYKNRSLERINPIGNSCDCYNWCSSVNCYGATPGEINSTGNIQCLRKDDLLVNEILFDPCSDNGEFIEIYNRSSQKTQLAGCRLNLGNNSYELTNVLHSVPPGEYFVFAADSSILHNYDWLNYSGNVYINENINFSLPNSGANISISDHWNCLIDTIYYENSFHNPNLVSHDNISLERVNFDLPALNGSNWNSCVDPLGATPGKSNSIFTDSEVTQSRFEVTPNPFSPDNDGFEDFTIFSYNLPGVVSRYQLRIFDCEGRLVRTLAENQLTGSRGEIIFNGLNDSGRPLRIGIYIALFEAADPSSGYQEVIKKPFVVARKF